MHMGGQPFEIVSTPHAASTLSDLARRGIRHSQSEFSRFHYRCQPKLLRQVWAEPRQNNALAQRLTPFAKPLRVPKSGSRATQSSSLRCSL